MAFKKEIFRHCILVLIAGVVIGCNGSDLISLLEDEDPVIRLSAIRQASQSKDYRALPYLVKMLGDEDGDVRLFSVGALRKITGESMGYHSYDSPAKRASAQERWREWLIGHGIEPRPARKPAEPSTGEKNE